MAQKGIGGRPPPLAPPWRRPWAAIVISKPIVTISLSRKDEKIAKKSAFSQRQQVSLPGFSSH